MMRRKLFSAMLVISMFASLLTGCGDNTQKENAGETDKVEGDGSGNGSGQDSTGFVHDSNLNEVGPVDADHPICKETVSLTIGVHQNVGVVDNYETNDMSIHLEEMGNFDLTFVEYPASEYLTQINLAVTAGGEDLPDVLLFTNGNGASDSVVASWGEAGAIIPLNDYFEHSAYYIPEAVERTGVNFYPNITTGTGEMYYVPRYNPTLTNEYSCKIWMYEPWLEALDLEQPTTPEEFRDVLYAFVNEDPNGNGVKDEIGLIGRSKDELRWFEALMTPFQYITCGSKTLKWFDVKDGVVSAQYITDGYREGLQYIRSLFDEGLIDPATFTNDLSQTQALLTQEDTVVGSYIHTSMSDVPNTDSRRVEYVGIAPLYSADGSQYTPYVQSSIYVGGVVTKNCKNPEAAFRLLDYMVSEEMSIWTLYGQEGVGWERPGEGDVGLYADDGYPAVLKELVAADSLPNHRWKQLGPCILSYDVTSGIAWDGDETSEYYLMSKIQGEYTGKHPEEFLGNPVYTDEEQKVIDEVLSPIDIYVREMIANFCTNNAGMDIYDDAVWEQYLTQLDSMGLEEATKVVQQAYDRMNK